MTWVNIQEGSLEQLRDQLNRQMRDLDIKLQYLNAIEILVDILKVRGVGPHVIGGVVSNQIQLLITGSFTSGGAGNDSLGFRVDSAITGFVGDIDKHAVMMITGSLLTQGTDTNIGVMAQALFTEPRITNNLASSGKPDVATTVYILDAPTEGDINAALYVKSGEVISVTHGYTMKEVTTPTALADHGRIYTKADNKLYFQDGAGTEHELAFV